MDFLSASAVRSFRSILQWSTATRPLAAAPLPLRSLLVLVSLSLFWALPLQAANPGGGGGKKYNISTSSSPTAGGATSGGGTYSSGSSVTVRATPSANYSFSSWTENGTVASYSASYTFTANANRNLVANFTAGSCTYAISTSSSPGAGGSTSGGGTVNCGSSVTVSAAPSANYSFSSWTDNGTVVSYSASYTFTANANRSLVANFTAAPCTYSIGTSSSPGAGGSTSGGGTVNCGSSVTVSAAPSANYSFSSWKENGTVVSYSASYTFTANANRSLVANFTAVSCTYSISTSSSPAAGGSTSGGGTVNCGSSVTVSAAPSANYSFSSWTENGTVVSYSASYTFTANANRNLVANFSSGTTPPDGYVTGVVPGTLRNDFSGWVGLQIVVGANSLTVTQLGRMMVSGNSGTHTVKLVNASDGTDVSGGSVSVAMSGGTAGQFKYGGLSSAVTLAASTTYYVVSQETAGGDQWYNFDTKVTTTGAATENAALWGYGAGQWYSNVGAGQAYVPVDFKYGTVTPTGQPPVAPSNLSATAVSSSQINLAWTDNSSDESGFIIQRASNSAGPWTQIATVGAGVTSYADTGLGASTTWYYCVLAYNSYGYSGYTSIASATTWPPPGQPPAAPSNLSATAASSSQISLAWTDNSSNESGFVIQRASSSAGPWTQIATVGAGVTSYADAGLSASTTYYYQVCAYNGYGNSATSFASATTTSPSSSGGQLQWLQTTLPQYMAQVNGVATDHSGNVIAVGYFNTSVDFGSGLITAVGYYDAFVAKYTPQGTLTWAKRIGGTAFDAAYGVAVDSQNNIIVVGTFQGSADFGAGPVSATGGSTDQDAFVAKYSPGSAGVPGTLIWARTWGGYPNDFAHAVAVDGSDNIIATSESSGTVYFGNGFTKTGHGSTEVALVKFQGVTAGPTLAGTTLWAQMYGGTYNDVAYGLAVDRNGDVAVTGYFNYGGVSGGNLGGTPFSGSASAGAFVAKYSGLDGGYRWSWVLGGTAGYGIAAEPGTANVFATGQGSSGFFVNAYDLSGTPLWAKTYGNSGDAGRAIAVDGGGNLALTGNCGSVDWQGNYLYSNGTGFFVSSLTTAGSFRWAVQGNNQSYGCGVAFDSLGHVLSGGYFYFTVDFGGISASALGGAYNAFVAQYSK